MGPQHESCGKPDKEGYYWRTVILQWGRNMRVAERPPEGEGEEESASFNGAAT